MIATAHESVFSTRKHTTTRFIMVVKEAIIFILVSGCLQVYAADYSKEIEFGEKSSEFLDHDYHVKPTKHPKEYKKKYTDPEHQFYKDYKQWDDKQYIKKDSHEFKEYEKINKIDSNEYVDKYNKYGHTFNPNLINLRKEKESYHEKTASEHEKKERPGSLLDDTNVNYINNNKEISGDSELITEKTIKMEKNKENYEENYQNGNQLNMKRYKKDFYQNLINIEMANPPPANDTIMMARYIVHTVDWAALGTISGRAPTKGAPFVCVKATSDGMKNASSGVPFFYMSPMDICTQDLQKDNRVSVLVTLSETEYCKNQKYDPQDPRCAKLTLSGKIKKIKPGSDEEKFAKNALFARHPAMASWPSGHNWYFTKLKIGQIILLDRFGGATYIKVKDYLNGGVVPDLKRK